MAGPWNDPQPPTGGIAQKIAKLRLHMRLAWMLVLFSQVLICLGGVFIVLSDLGTAIPLLILGAVSWAVTRRWTMWLERASLKVLDEAKARRL